MIFRNRGLRMLESQTICDAVEIGALRLAEDVPVARIIPARLQDLIESVANEFCKPASSPVLTTNLLPPSKAGMVSSR